MTAQQRKFTLSMMDDTACAKEAMKTGRHYMKMDIQSTGAQTITNWHLNQEMQDAAGLHKRLVQVWSTKLMLFSTNRVTQ